MTTEDPKFEALLDYIRRSRGFDFGGYKRPSLRRRVLRRMQTVAIEGFVDYLDYLEVHPDEFTQLFNTILINVTSFFRDEAAWTYLAKEVIPRILANKPAGAAIRMWSAGCATGEEAYALAMLLAEAIGPEAFHERAKIYATDVDEEALGQARQAAYSARAIETVPPNLQARYFEPVGERHVFRADLRRSVIFGRHDLLNDAPISRLDLLACRNTLMYFNVEAQTKVLSRFHFALADGGYLFLGKAEMLFTHANLFTPVDLRYRIFAKSPNANMRDRLVAAALGGEPEAVNHFGRSVRMREVAFDASPVAQVVIDADGILALANECARSMFGLAPTDLGRPLQDLELSYRPVELRSLIERAYAEHRAVTLSAVEQRLSETNLRFLDVEVRPLVNGGALGVSVSFDDVTQRQQLQAGLSRANQELETAYEELQSAHEELETTNEELQSTNEELETTNEELQSTNEELETMNEELQSTNEELQAMNQELRERSDEASNMSAFLESIYSGMRSGLVVVGRQLNVLVWNRRAEDLWGVRAEETKGRSFLDLDIGLPVEKLPIAAFLAEKADNEELTLAATNRRGRSFNCHITLTPYVDAQGERQGVVLLMDEATP